MDGEFLENDSHNKVIEKNRKHLSIDENVSTYFFKKLMNNDEAFFFPKIEG